VKLYYFLGANKQGAIRNDSVTIEEID